MSVLAVNRKQSDFKVISYIFDIRKELTTYVLRDFAIDGKLDYMEEYFLNDERTEILHDIRGAASCLEMANSIMIMNESEYYERRNYQDRAIGYLNCLKQELNFVVETLGKKINVNKYLRSIEMIDEEIGLISRWRKSDNKRLKDLLNDSKTKE